MTKLLALLFVVGALLVWLGSSLFRRHEVESPLSLAHVSASERDPESHVLDSSETARAQVRLATTVPVSATPPQHDALAPDGKPWAKTMQITTGDSHQEFTVEWVGNMRRVIHDNGQVYADTTFVNGKREGVERVWHRNGQPWAIENWHEGKREGTSTYFRDSGALLSRGAYSKGYRDGSWEEWYEDGSRRSVGSYRSDPGRYTQVKEGRWTAWLPNGSIDESATGYFDDGERVGP